MFGKVHLKLLKAVDLLSGPGGCTIGDLMEALELSRRSVYRVLDSLQELNFPVYSDRRGPSGEKRWMLDQGYVKKLPNINLPEVRLEHDELAALYLLLSAACTVRNTRYETALSSAVKKLGLALPSGARPELFSKLESIFVSGGRGKDYAGHEQVIGSLLDAIMGQKTCTVTYHAFSSDQVKTYRIDPLRLFEHRGGLYLFARVVRYGHVRVLAVERIKELAAGNEKFSYPEDFDPAGMIDSAFDLTFDDPIDAKIWFSANQARYVEGRRWAAEQSIEKRHDGSIVLRVRTSGSYDLKRWVLSFGAEAEVIEPPALREELRDELRRMRARYG